MREREHELHKLREGDFVVAVVVCAGEDVSRQLSAHNASPRARQKEANAVGRTVYKSASSTFSPHPACAHERGNAMVHVADGRPTNLGGAFNHRLPPSLLVCVVRPGPPGRLSPLLLRPGRLIGLRVIERPMPRSGRRDGTLDPHCGQRDGRRVDSVGRFTSASRPARALGALPPWLVRQTVAMRESVTPPLPSSILPLLSSSLLISCIADCRPVDLH